MPRTTNRNVTKPQCEGWTRTGIFQMGGTGRWEQCRAKAVYKITFTRAGERTKTLPACENCFKKVVNGEDQEAVTIQTVKRIK
jgi:hypothetical protein